MATTRSAIHAYFAATAPKPTDTCHYCGDFRANHGEALHDFMEVPDAG